MSSRVPSASPPKNTGARKQDEPVLSVQRSTWRYLLQRRPMHTFMAVAAMLLLESAAWWVASANDLAAIADTNTETVILLLLFLLPLLIPIVLYLRVYFRMQKLFFTELADSLGFTYAPSASTGTVSGSFFERGHDRALSHVLSGTYKDAALRLYNYSFIVGLGRYQEQIQYIVGEIEVQHQLPHLLIRPHTSLMTIDPALVWKPSDTKPLTVEGDFNKEFSVYVPQGEEIEALEILQPDAMAMLMEGYKEFGFECYGVKTYVFKLGVLKQNRDEVLVLLQLIERLYEKLLPELERVRIAS